MAQLLKILTLLEAKPTQLQYRVLKLHEKTPKKTKKKTLFQTQ
jgi:hypothetical protein